MTHQPINGHFVIHEIKIRSEVFEILGVTNFCYASLYWNIEHGPKRMNSSINEILQLWEEAGWRCHIVLEMNVVLREVFAVTHYKSGVNVFLRAPSSSTIGVTIFLFLCLSVVDNIPDRFQVIDQKRVRVFNQGFQTPRNGVFGTPDGKRSTSFWAGFSN